MEKKNKIILIAIVVVTVLVLGGCVYSVINNKKNVSADAIKFRNEYMELNDKINEANNQPYINVTLNDTNTIEYVSEKEAVELLEDGTGVIYFGFSACPWCRSLVSTLAKIAEEKEETIYYLDILDIRSSFEIKEGQIDKIKDGTKNYYKILEELDEELEDFYLVDEAGNKYNTGEKRLYAPTLVAVNDGDVTSFHVGTVASQKSGYDALTEEQTEELEKIITKLINSKNKTETCSKDKC